MRVWISTLIAALALVGAAHAQQPPARLGALHDALGLTATQEPAWQAYQAAISNHGDADARHRAAQQMMATLPTPRRIALLDATMQQDLADLHREGLAVVAFYNQLTPAQQATFDRQTLQTEDRSPAN